MQMAAQRAEARRMTNLLSEKPGHLREAAGAASSFRDGVGASGAANTPTFQVQMVVNGHGGIGCPETRYFSNCVRNDREYDSPHRHAAGGSRCPSTPTRSTTRRWRCSI